MFEKARDRGVDGTEQKRWMDGTERTERRRVSLLLVSGETSARTTGTTTGTTTRRRREEGVVSLVGSSTHRFIHSFVRSFALGVFLALARASGGFARDDDDDDDDGWWWFAASFGGVG